MALSRIVYPGNGVQTDFSIPFALGYLKESDITCQVDDEVDGLGGPMYRSIEFLTPTFVRVSGAPADTKAVFTRTVDREALLVDFEDGDILNEENLNTAQKQAIMLVHETLDGRFESFQSDFDLNGFRVRNIGEPIDDSDAATKAYADDKIADGAVNAANAAASAATATTQAGLVATAKTESETARDWSYKWSNESEDVPVNDGVHTGYSAYHWSRKASVFDPALYCLKVTYDPVINAKAPLDSPALIGTPTAPTPEPGDTSSQIATTAFISDALENRNINRSAHMSLSGLSFLDFGSIPVWVKRITLDVSALSTSATASVLVHLGTSADIQTTGYYGFLGAVQTSSASGAVVTTGLPLSINGPASYSTNIRMTITKVGTNKWMACIAGYEASVAYAASGGGTVTLTGDLTQLRILTTAGTFDAGTATLLLE